MKESTELIGRSLFRAPKNWACLFLLTLTIGVYWQVGTFEFIAFDDNMYVTENPDVKAGLTGESIRWAFDFTNNAAFGTPLPGYLICWTLSCSETIRELIISQIFFFIVSMHFSFISFYNWRQAVCYPAYL